ncbi:hypothetical protein [Legionella drancourtii]|uniref:Transmembrane protein n=1 Tax=Legionella drancourtii LLAP12 TaxID=658187 RepID=G9ELG6_9GAMM|nr:hypothetical protein [Legionella drancourtii]EHL31801.1 hypothetical protein LDG_5964 [Legionella drancourtii LLAP12]
MNVIKPLKILQLNLYSWFLIIVYLAASITMESHSNAAHWEGFYLSSPIIILVIIWSEIRISILNSYTGAISKKEAIFHNDLFLITFSFISGTLLSFLFEYKNSDVLGWWPVIIYIMAIYGFLFAFIFSFTARGLDDHKKYTFVYFFLLLLFPSLSLLGCFDNNRFNVFIGLLLGVHLLFVLVYRILLLIRKSTSK